VTDIIIFGTSVLVDDLRTGCHQARISSVTGLIRTSAVVLAELWRGAAAPAEQRFLRALERNQPVLIPTKENWLESRQILARIRAALGFSPDKLRDLHFDILIALTARSHGARVITSNGTDFTLIQRYRKFELEIW
jgi:predicted nucleic acid-binding protein